MMRAAQSPDLTGPAHERRTGPIRRRVSAGWKTGTRHAPHELCIQRKCDVNNTDWQASTRSLSPIGWPEPAS
jgi:hypothetical protein